MGDAPAGLLSVRFLDRTIRPQVTKEGLKFPKREELYATLDTGLEPLPKTTGSSNKQWKGSSVLMCSFVHFLNLLWQPLLKFVGVLGKSADPPWTDDLKVHAETINGEIGAVVVSAGEHVTVDDWVEFIRRTLERILGIAVPTELIQAVAAPVAPVSLSCTRANALHFLRSSQCSRLVGPAVTEQVSRKLLAEVAQLPVELLSEPDLARGVKQDLVAGLAERECGQEVDEEAGPAKKYRRRDSFSLEKALVDKTEQVLYTLRNRVAVSRLEGTVVGACELVRTLADEGGAPQPTEDLVSLLASRYTLQRHLLLLDSAVDTVTSDRLMDLRGKGLFAGAAVATDESPPSQPRFRGLRFQISVFYWGTFAPVEQWNSATAPPLTVRSTLGDIMHCPGKKGVDVSRVLEKQLSRLGLSGFDIVSGVGDGGGENEGSSGVHSYFENLSPGYVRRRCLPHIAWRTCDQAIKEAGLDYKTLAAHFSEGITWSRLRQIAVTPKAQGGLGELRDGSKRLKDLSVTDIQPPLQTQSRR